MLSKTEGVADFDYRLARYGPGIEAAAGAGEGTGAGAQAFAVAVAVADPFDGCDDKAYTASKNRLMLNLHNSGRGQLPKILPFFCL